MEGDDYSDSHLSEEIDPEANQPAEDYSLEAFEHVESPARLKSRESSADNMMEVDSPRENAIQKEIIVPNFEIL